jgi:hypothetical protein
MSNSEYKETELKLFKVDCQHYDYEKENYYTETYYEVRAGDEYVCDASCFIEFITCATVE